jgi:hypothetical protein
MQQLVDLLRLRREALLVIGLAAESRHCYVERRRVENAYGQ